MSDDLNIDELSDDELRARLTERGYVDPSLSHYVDNRDDPDIEQSIRRILGDDE